MQILTTLSASPKAPLSPPFTLTIGNFDGVHKGHQVILERLRAVAGKEGTVAVITFSNHPSHVLARQTPAALILTPARKLHHLRTFQVDLVYLLEFTPSLAQLSYDHFLAQVKEVYPFTFLAFGEGASFGKNREGNPENMHKLSEQLGFTLEYLPKVTEQGEVISSGKIRTYLEAGDFVKARALLGHPFP